jgi:signal peptidase I
MVEMLARGGTVNFNPRGVSMLPTIHNDGDRVVLAPIVGKLKKYDLPFYKRDNGQFVLHRIVGVNSDGTYELCGDNQWHIEHCVRHDQLIGVAKTIVRSGRSIDCTTNSLYNAYVRLWVMLRPVRHIVIGGFRKVKGCASRLFKQVN